VRVALAPAGDLSMKALNALALVLLVVGGLNWGFVALTGNKDLVTMLFADTYAAPGLISKVIYGLVGVAAILYVVSLKAMQGGFSPTPRTA
jgi:uncharacterized membrane protein YuzA (DUF378 family)